jgi:methyl-accepting chemotaxis protein
MIKGIKEEKEGAGNVNERFQQIMENTMSVKDNLQSLSSSVDELREANEGISNSIQTISAVTEQVTAHANETMEAEENNAEILQKIVLKMDDLMGQIN